MKFYSQENEEIELIIPLISLLNGTQDVQSREEEIVMNDINLKKSKFHINSRIEQTENNEIGKKL